MFKPIPVFLGLRYTRAKRRNNFISVISFISILGVGLGVTVLITVLSVMNGFEQQLRSRLLGTTSHASVIAFTETFNGWQKVQEEVLKHPEIIAAAPFVEGQGMLRKGSAYSGVAIKGIEPEKEAALTIVDDKQLEGDFFSLEAGKYRISLGVHLAKKLGVFIGDKVDLMIPQASTTPTGLIPRFRRFEVVSIFEVDMYQYDSAVALVHIADLQKLYRFGDEVSGVRIEMLDMFDAPRISTELTEQLEFQYIVHDWTKMHQNFFQAVAMEKTVMFFILLMIIVIAAVNIVSTLVMLVTEKKADIAVLRTLGLSPAGVSGIFLVQGAVIGLTGTILGALGGVALASNLDVIIPFIETLMGRPVISGDVYMITQINGDVRLQDLLKITSASFLICMLFTIFPAVRAAKTQPAEALRYE